MANLNAYNKENTSTGLISVIVPVFRVEEYLARCIDSIINQSYKNLEIILVDDGSDDNSGKICDEYALADERIVVIHKENGGQSSARNLALEVARGEYVGFVDSDDVIHKNMYTNLFSLIISYGADMALCNIRDWDGKEDFSNIALSGNSYAVDNNEMMKRFFRIESSNSYISPCRKLFKRYLVKDLRFEEGRINEDVYFSYRTFLDSKKIAITDDQYYFYFIRGGSTTHSYFCPRDYDLFKAWENVMNYAKEYDKNNVRYAELNYYRCYFTLLMKYALYGASGFENISKDIKRLKKNLRKNLKYLLPIKGISVSRKLAMIMLAISVRMVRLFCKIRNVLR